MSFKPMKFRVNEIVIRDRTRPIVLAATPSSSAFVALANFVLLSEPVSRKFQTEGGNGRPKYVHRDVLTQMIEMVAVRNLEKDLAVGNIDAYSMLECWKKCKQTLSLLPNGFTLRPKITSCKEFEHAEEFHLFALFGAQFCHGWLVDPKEDADTVKAIGTRTYEEMLSMSKIALRDSSKIASEGSSKAALEVASESDHNAALIIKKFLDNSKDQLTSYGLSCLHQEIDDGTVHILFKNNHFDLVYKHKGTLVAIQADEELAKKHPDAMWSLLEVVDGARRLFTYNFRPIEQQVMGSDDRGTVQTSEIRKSKPSKKQRDKNKRQGLLKKSMDEIRSHLEVQQQPQEEIQEVEVKEQTQEELDDAMSEKFSDFLSEFREEGIAVPFFNGQVKALDHCGTFKLKVSFDDLKSHDKDNARYICDNMPRISERLTQCVRDFLLMHDEFKTKSTDVFEKTKLEISGLPAPYSVLPFRKFAKNNKMHRVWVLFDYGGKKVNSTTYVGRQAALGLLKCILKKHKEGRCWAGSFREEDIEVRTHSDGSVEFVITAEDSYDFTQENRIADFNTFCVLIFPYFMSDELNEMPAYFDQFQVDYLLHQPKFEDTENYGRWQKYMSSHFAFKAPQVCATLITETFEVCNSEWHWHVNPTDDYLDFPGDLKNWVQFILKSGSLTLIETYQHGGRDHAANRYDDLSYRMLLMFGRHFSWHLLEKKQADGTMIPVQDLVIIGLMLGHGLRGEMAKVIRQIYMMKNNFGAPLFSSAWRHFEASETYDDEVQEVLNTADAVSSANPADMVGSPIEPEA